MMRIVEEQAGIDDVRAALDLGELVVVPTDTVYGLAALAADEEAVRRLYQVKGRSLEQPTAAVFASSEQLFEHLPDLDPRSTWAVRSLLPGPWTLVVDAPMVRWTWLTGGEDAPLGIRVPAGALDLPPIAATSANESGRPTAATVADIDESLAEHVSIVVDRGRLDPSAESTVLDLVAWSRGQGDVRVLRDTAGRAAQAIAVLGVGP